MPNIKSAKKRVKVTKVKTANNQSAKNALRTEIKKFNAVVETGDKAAAEKSYAKACSMVDKAVDKGILHVNTASRKKKTMAHQVAAL